MCRRPVGPHLIKGRKSRPSLAAAHVVDIQVSPPESGYGREPAAPGMMLGTQQSGAAWRHCLMDTVMSSEHEGWRACGKVKLTLLLVLCYSLCVLYKKETLFLCTKMGCDYIFITLLRSATTAVLSLSFFLLFYFIFLSVATSFLSFLNLF